MTMRHFTGRAVVLGALVASAFAANQAVAQQQEPRVFGETAARGNGIGLHTPNLDVALYGLLDVTLSTANNIDAVGHRRTNFQKPWFSGPRWGVVGSRALPDGAPNLIFKLEGEYLLDTGEEDTPGVLFNRDAWVGFQGETMGKLTFGRQNTLARDFSHIYGDPYTASGQVTLDEGGWTHGMQLLPDGSADFVSHRPDQLDHCLRWLCQTPSESALGLMLPATAEADE